MRARVTDVMVQPRQWVRTTSDTLLLVCCDCGLAHRFRVRWRRGRLEFLCVRDARYTARVRRVKQRLFQRSQSREAETTTRTHIRRGK